ncbi:MAG: 23S rRNA (guanosine(2251)-2'-O)-methyltransferase RlmB [Holosporaceae bacterium]|jgi:23S rRNA (guanosine2251-2'-O)-methyltransferase|nr:23S rRNA (guanosine(2251)-2'-O)-methyltransferase RlmB [Holosporaceae bacterium]
MDTEWIYGKHAVKAALKNPKRVILRFVVLKSARVFWEEKNRPEIVDRNFFKATFREDIIHQGCAILVKKLKEPSIEELIADKSDERPLVLLDQIKDPQNIGSILRGAAVFGARAVITTKDNSPRLTSSIIKAASGALEIVPLIFIVNLVQTINNLKKHGFWCLGLDETASKTINEIPLDGKMMIVIGSEGDGMRRLTKESCDFIASLPSYSLQFSTLNAAQAATISLYEIFKQKR